MTKLSRDPTQSLWLERKYSTDLNKVLAEITQGMIDIAAEGGDAQTIRAKITDYKNEQYESRVRPMLLKHKTMQYRHGVKMADLSIRRMNARKKT